MTATRALVDRGVGKKAIARELGISINTMRRYVRQPLDAGRQVRPTARRLTDAWRDLARAPYTGPAGGNAVLVQRLLGERGLAVSTRTNKRAVAGIRRAERMAQCATVRVETHSRISCRLISASSGPRVTLRQRDKGTDQLRSLV